MLLGLHCSISGGLHNAFEEAEEFGINTVQIFTKNQRQWQERVVEEEESTLFKKRMKEANVKVAFSHSIYLMNLASIDPDLWNRSVDSLTAELKRCHALGLDFTVLHPGSAKDLSEAEGIKKIAKGVAIALKKTQDSPAKILLENTAGQGSTLGHKFSQLNRIMEEVADPRVGICFDTCHGFAAGYDLRTKAGTEDTFAKLDKEVGLQNLKCLHLNDSKGELGSHLDRHEHIGQGKIGLAPFEYIINQFKEVPKVLETPKKEDMDGVNLKILREMLK